MDFSSNISDEYENNLNAEFVGLVKTNNKGLYKFTINNLMKCFTGGSYLVLKSNLEVPLDGPLVDIGYSFISWKVISSIAYMGGGIKKPGTTYLSK